jgi:UDP-N-acetylmuramoyl-tripeptide--D-alanyl-D-alanine ligase
MFKIHELTKAAQGRLIKKGKNADVKGISIDSRTIKKGEAFVAIKGDNFNGHDFIETALKKGASCIIAEKKPRHTGSAAFIKVKDTIKVLGKVARFNRANYNIPVIAITGSNGKTTAKDMIVRVLSSKFKVLGSEGTKNNHIGLPLTLLKLDKTYDIAVLELGTNHFGEIRYLADIASPNIGIITNIGPAHLKYLKDLEGVFKEKRGLITALKSPAIAVLNADDKYLRKELAKKNNRVFKVSVGIKNKGDFTASSIRYAFKKYRFKVNKRLGFALGALGYYNIYNSLISIAVARIFGMGYREISSALSGFKPPYGRLNIINKKGIRFIDDTYNSNPSSLKQAIDSLKKIRVKGRKIAVIGDMLELGKESLNIHRKDLNEAAKSCDTLITAGRISSLSLKGFKLETHNIISCRDSAKAREILFKDIKVNSRDIVLVKGSRRMKMEEVFNF